MFSAAFRLWRSIATGVCFLMFGLIELSEAAFVLPWIYLVATDPAKRKRVGKWLMHVNFKAFVGLMHALGVLTYETRNLERLARPGLLVVANHPTLIDIVFLLSFLSRADCIIKGALERNPFTRYAIGVAGLIPNSLSGVALLDRCVQSLGEGNSLVLFPEGTRSEHDRLRAFQRGASHIAMRGKKNITPVVIRVSEHNLGRNSSWWKAPRKAVHFIFDVKDDIPIEPFLASQTERVRAARELTRYLSAYFTQHTELT